MYFFTLEVCPKDNVEKSCICKAVVNVWINLANLDDARIMVLQSLSSEGWEITQVIDSRIVKLTDYGENDEGRDLFKQAFTDQEVYSVHSVPRVALFENTNFELFFSPSTTFFEYQEKLKSLNEVWILYSEEEVHVAVVEEQEIVPVFIDEKSAKKWVDLVFHNCEPRLTSKALLHFISHDNGLFALEDFENNCLVTTSVY